jgi:hypothetical protein
MELTLEDLKMHMEKYFEVNGKYPNVIRLSLKMKKVKGFRAYCNRIKLKVNYV